MDSHRSRVVLVPDYASDERIWGQFATELQQFARVQSVSTIEPSTDLSPPLKQTCDALHRFLDDDAEAPIVVVEGGSMPGVAQAVIGAKVAGLLLIQPNTEAAPRVTNMAGRRSDWFWTGLGRIGAAVRSSRRRRTSLTDENFADQIEPVLLAETEGLPQEEARVVVDVRRDGAIRWLPYWRNLSTQSSGPRPTADWREQLPRMTCPVWAVTQPALVEQLETLLAGAAHRRVIGLETKTPFPWLERPTELAQVVRELADLINRS